MADFTNSSQGYLYLITGPMFAGKSSKLIRLIRNFKSKNIPVLVLKHSLDTRYNGLDSICSHDKIKEPCQSTDQLDKYLTHPDYQAAKVIIIEEAQFFGEDIVRFCEHAMDVDSKYLIVTGLSSDYKRRPFGFMPHLEALCQEKEFLYADCYFCEDCVKAPYTAKIAGSDQTIDVGEADKYKPACLAHWLANNSSTHI
jgi:thymidine kinase